MPTSNTFLSGLAAFAALTQLAYATTCQHQPINSIQYCQETTAITYSNIADSGTYQDVSGYDMDSCTCSFTPKDFSGGLAPLNEELSLHLRGPIILKKFAAYTPNTKAKRHEDHVRRHAHGHLRKRKDNVLTVTSTTTITITVPASDATPAPGSGGQGSNGGYGGTGPGASGVNVDTISGGDEVHADIASSKTSAAAPTASSASAVTGDWNRISFFDAEAGKADGLVFLNHMGGQGSGTFDNCFGNSISYANGTANGGSAKPTILEDILIPSNNEFIIMTDRPCEGNDCGVHRPGIPAYHGFGGDNKVFLFEFQMPEDKNCPEFNRNIPAIWALNAKIPRNVQYGKCSCWDTGCGEIDLFETLVDADDFLKTHYHSKQGAVGKYGGGGAPDFFARPYSKPIQAAVVFSGTSVTIKVLDEDTSFAEALSSDFVKGCEKSVSVFAVPS
ncbi:hypothetical protein P167DRAFT_274066 [Morchella conica CCBAS932]|uniref:glucan endo-1,3-beta-D-glucosidase n=1 Tax=Morchella conica CCBAS932 TaxID=1392247 RepID=A0A3N4KL38_9PEZI|nr:hypothetical protein P167DRAFT_274066 [Morchella conica CCBAS932]